MPSRSSDAAAPHPSLGATLVVLLHYVVALYIVLGAVLVRAGWVPWWLHVPAAAWGVIVHATAVGCPLTRLEHRLRGTHTAPPEERLGFVDRHLLCGRKTSRRQNVMIAAGILAVNLVLYLSMRG